MRFSERCTHRVPTKEIINSNLVSPRPKCRSRTYCSSVKDFIGFYRKNLLQLIFPCVCTGFQRKLSSIFEVAHSCEWRHLFISLRNAENVNKPFGHGAKSHVLGRKLHNNKKQRQVKVDWYELLCSGSPTVQLYSVPAGAILYNETGSCKGLLETWRQFCHTVSKGAFGKSL